VEIEMTAVEIEMTAVEIAMTAVEIERTETTAVVTVEDVVEDVAVVAINFDLQLFHKKPIAGSIQLSVFM
jgi:D-alanyl-D-alanine dipeptidase